MTDNVTATNLVQQVQQGWQELEARRKATGRQCGNCTLCCRLLGVDAPPVMSKPPNTNCQHCTPGRGCGIYDHRPTQCRTYHCLWLIDPTFDDAFYPAKSHFVISIVDDGRGGDGVAAIVEVDPHRPDSWLRTPYLERISQVALRLPSSTVRVGRRWFKLFSCEVAKHPELISVKWGAGDGGRVLPGHVGPNYIKTVAGDFEWLEIEPPAAFFDAWRITDEHEVEAAAKLFEAMQALST